MEYKVDFEDIQFTLFDFLKIGELKNLPYFEGQSQEMYLSVLEEALKFAKKEIAPLNEKGDRIGAQVKDGKVVMPEGFKEVLANFAANGFMGVDLDPAYGGMGLPASINIAVSEFVMGACASFAFFHLLTRGDCALLQAFASEEQKKLYIPNMLNGRWNGTMCLTEPQAGSAVGDLTTVAKPNGDGTYQIHGTKIFITCGNHDLTENVIHLVLARVEGDAPGTKGISLFIVPEKRVSPDGSLGEDNDVKLVSIEHKMGIKASPTCLLQFGDNGKCQGYLVGEQSRGMVYMFQLMNEARVAVGQQGVALAGPAYEYALGYAKERTQGGKTLIVNYPDVRRMLMTQKAYVEALRALVFEGASCVDYAWHHSEEAVREEYEAYAGILTPVVKAFGSDMGFRSTELAIQTYGGYGFIQDYPVEQYMRDLKIASLYEGTNGIQAMDLIGRKFLRDGGKNLTLYGKRLSTQLQEVLEEDSLKPLAQKILNHLQSFQKAAEAVAAQAMENQHSIGLNATPFLRALGDIVCAQLLVRRAKVALEQIDSAPTEERKKFLQSKIEVARFYVEQLLPEADLNIARILSKDTSAMADVL
ncbi:MAG: acyl-CoA dehydrogenase [Deltaproteobacteria bacterium]|nr:acyl-CoA dehydrogenase [Deltaproteobacteria bacterium]